MAEPDKVTASSSKAKEKTCSILDDDISKNFLGSWNTSLGAESDDSSMDFKYEPAKGKKENFNFDKLDMDFSLDGEFGKMDSFKDDMGDLDFSSPAKTSAKTKATDIDFSSPPKERTDGSEKSKKGKKDCFAFSFDFNDLDKFDLDAVLPTRTKDLAKDYGDKGVKIKSTEKKEDQSSNIQVTGTDASEADVLKDKSKLMNPKENLAACVDEFDMLLQSDSSKTSPRGVSTDKLSKSENKACSESCEKSKLQNQATHFVQDERLSEPALICSEGATTEHAQSIENQSDQVKSSNENSNEMPKVQNQSACSFPDKINAPDVPEQMQTTLADEKSGDVDSETPTLNAKIDSSLTSENENYPVEKMMPHYESKHVRSLEVVLEVTDEEENSSEISNVLKGDMATTTVGETVADVKESDAVDLPKLGHHVAEPTSGRQKTRTDISSSLVSRFNLKPLTKDESPASAQVSHRSNLVSLNRNTSSLHPNPSGARHSAESARIRSNMDKSSASRNKEVIGGHLVSENNMKVANDQSTRGNCNSTEAPTKINLDVGGKAVERGATFPGIENKEEDTKSSSIQVQSSVLPDRTSKTTNQASLNLKPKVPSFESVRKLKMDTVVGKLSTLKVSKKIPNLEGLKLLSSPALKDKAVIANNLNKNYMTVAAKKVPPVGSVNPRSPALSMKRKISEVSDAAPTMSNASKRISASHSRTSKDDSEEMAREEVTIYKNILDCSLKGDSNKHSESTFEIPHEMKFPDVGVTASLEKDEYVEKAEAFGKELDQICSILRKKQEEAKELLVQALVTNNRLLLLGSPMHAQKLCQVKGFAARLISKELPSRCVDPPSTALKVSLSCSY